MDGLNCWKPLIVIGELPYNTFLPLSHLCMDACTPSTVINSGEHGGGGGGERLPLTLACAWRNTDGMATSMKMCTDICCMCIYVNKSYYCTNM